MTPEREQYLAGISEKERSVRYHIRETKKRIFLAKAMLPNLHPLDISLKIRFHTEIKQNKILLSILKKQLPAPLKHELDDCICRCGVHYSRLDTSMMFYCQRCGQAINSKTWHIPRNWQRVGK